MSAAESSFSSPYSHIKEASHSPLTQKEVSEILTIYSPLGNEVDAILKSLLTASHNTPDLGDHLTAGRGYIGIILQAALQQKTIQNVSFGLEKIRDVVKARADGNVKRLFFPGEFATRAAFIGTIEEKIKALEEFAKRFEKEESHAIEEKDKKEESDVKERLRVMQAQMEEKISEKDKKLEELARRQLEEKKLKEEEIETSRREVESAKREASNLQNKVSDLSSEKEKAEQEIERVKKETEELSREKDELKEQKSSLEIQNEKVTEKLKQQEERNKELENAAANWNQLRILALSFIPEQSAESSALIPASDANIAVFQLVARMLREKAEEQRMLQEEAEEQRQKERAIEETAQREKAAQKEKQGQKVLEPKTYANYDTDKQTGKSIYALDDMQAMILYRKPLLVFKVIKRLLAELGRLNEEIKPTISHSSSSAFKFSAESSNPKEEMPNNMQAKIHNIQVILCYFFAYNAPMYFLVEQAKQLAQKDQKSGSDSWKILQMINDQIPGLKEIEDIIQKEIAKQDQQDDYETYNKFIQSGIAELSKQKDRNGKLLSAGYCEPHHTFTYHQRLGVAKLFKSQNIAQIFGDSKLAHNFCKTLQLYLNNYEAAYKKDLQQPTMDVEIGDGQLNWINSAILLTQPQTSGKGPKR